MRCSWCNLKNPLYVDYHDKEFSHFTKDEHYLYEMFILETFVSGLSFECILNKRENFRKTLDNFDLEKIINYNDAKLQELLNDKGIIRNKSKLNALISNSKIYKKIIDEFSSFNSYLIIFTKDEIIYENDKTTNELSDNISKDLIKRGMKYVGSVTIYSYLCAIGRINAHQKECFLYKKIFD